MSQINVSKVKAEIQAILADPNLKFIQGQLLTRILNEVDLNDIDPMQAWIWVKSLDPKINENDINDPRIIEEELNNLKAEVKKRRAKR